MKQINATTFKAQCLKLMDQIQQFQTEIVVTKRGKPWVKVSPIGDSEPQPLIGSMAGMGETVADLTQPIDESWNADS